MRIHQKVPGVGCRVSGRHPPAFRITRHTPPVTRRAFSLVEILVVMTLLSVIIIGLLAMFNQTQRAFRLGMTQTDVLEGGRITTDLMVRDLEQMTPSYQNFTRNFFALLQAPSTSTQVMPGSLNSRANVMEDLFFLTRKNQTWTGIGYFVRTTDPLSGNLGIPTNGFGTLYRFSMDYSASQFATNSGQMYAAFWTNAGNGSVPGNAANMGVSKIMDGVVDFKIRPSETSGTVISFSPLRYSPFSWSTNPPSSARLGNLVATNFLPAVGEVGLYQFFSNAVPSSVELEIGIMEQATLQRLQSIPNAAIQQQFFLNQAGHVQLFRQRVAIRTVDPAAYQ